METICDELSVEIFKYIDTPISLVLSNHKWYSISKDPYTRASWLVYKYGKAFAFFHAVRLGGNFITPEVVKALLGQQAILSRYFIQKLMLQFGIAYQHLNDIRAQF